MSPDPSAPAELSFGAAYDRLQAVAAELGADATMAPDRLIALLREGKGLERALRDHLERVEQEVRAIEDGEGTVPYRIVDAATPARPQAPAVARSPAVPDQPVAPDRPASAGESDPPASALAAQAAPALAPPPVPAATAPAAPVAPEPVAPPSSPTAPAPSAPAGSDSESAAPAAESEPESRPAPPQPTLGFAGDDDIPF
ncbi:hypothetical protein [Patulibacter sp.]|uniref:hypothetical protein n=1 Tax=Patulibacter sp. TaxID=1912859 RepID=UPI002716D3E8|nr:hypothetical protein [Patulibacter sp.]MDO9409679.1 hypothetical protein [Patulibacter sp.]